MREVLIDDDALDHRRVFQLASDLAFDLDVVKVNVPSLQVCNRQDCVDTDACQLFLAGANHLGAQGRAGRLLQGGFVILHDVHLLGDLRNTVHSHLAGALEACGDSEGVDALLDEAERLLEHGACHHNDASGAIANLVVLRLGQLHQELGDVMGHVHLFQDSGSIVRDQDIPIRSDNHLVHALWSHGASNGFADRLGGEDVGLVCLCSLQSLLSLLLLQDDEWVAVFIDGELPLRHRHGGRLRVEAQVPVPASPK
mmetsp:Transcript_29972/g.45143  ORF Transcript_29972/g.45143 Transcript_29972/m.45143 type:complete len:255 (+) Transcript_29972:1049-1813(+)